MKYSVILLANVSLLLLVLQEFLLLSGVRGATPAGDLVWQGSVLGLLRKQLVLGCSNRIWKIAVAAAVTHPLRAPSVPMDSIRPSCWWRPPSTQRQAQTGCCCCPLWRARNVLKRHEGQQQQQQQGISSNTNSVCCTK